ncbi:hypothetical protein GEV33_001035 [Tenebrio molitor]|uniref:RNA-directed DNA polymerase n=1 Tax=Tenebrio molitor TaxID=7067 RepID=A0A8J6HXX7_TENMO|nr:hypothetical protein GEV33_001035 [Tenebrio molitor]
MSSEEERMTPALKRKKLRRIEKRLHEVESGPSFGSHQGEDKMIPEFDPQRTDQPLESWVRRVDELAACYRWSDLTTVKLVANRPIGLARRLYDSQDCLAVSWKKMKKVMVNQFSKPTLFAKLLRESALYEEREGQDLSEYCFNKIDKLNALQLKIPETSLVDAVIGGITDEGIARAAKASRFQNTNGLYAYLSAIGKMLMTTPSVKSDRLTKPYPTPRGLNDHPTPLDALYRLRMIILGKGPGMVQSNLNTEDKSEEDFIVAKLHKKKTGDYRMCVDYRWLNAIIVKDKYPLPLIEDQLDRLGRDNDGARYKNTVAFLYMDDVIIPSVTIQQGLNRLRLVLKAFQKHDLKLKLSKCTFFSTKINYLGREISEHGIRPSQVKIEAVLAMTPPENVKQVRQFLGLSGYFRKFAKDYSRIVEPLLTRLRGKDVKWCWEAEQQQAFEKVKSILTTRPLLAIFNPQLPTELHTDASALDKQTTVDQRQYHSYELETMAVVNALKHFCVYLLGMKFTVVTDCNALKAAFSKKDLIPRIGRCRYPVADIEVNNVDLTESDWLVSAQLQDEQLKRIRNILESKIKNNETRQYFELYQPKDLLFSGITYYL